MTAGPALNAQTVFDWNGGAGSWTGGVNWSTLTVPDSAGADVLIDNGDAADSAVTLLNANATLGRLTIDAGDSLTFANTSDPVQQFVLAAAQGAFAGSGMILNNGMFSINAIRGGPTLMRIGDSSTAQTVTLNGTGTLIMGNSPANQITAFGTSQTFVNNSTIAGAGTIGGGLRAITNTGTILATSLTNRLIVNSPNTITNTETLRAGPGATLQITGTNGAATGTEGLINDGGVIEARGNGAVVELSANRVRGGILQTRDGGVIRLFQNNLILDGSTSPITISAGSDVRVPDGVGPDAKGTLIIDGTLSLDSTGAATRLQVYDLFVGGMHSLTLNGSGSVLMSNQSVNEINSVAGGSTLIANIPIIGSGKIGGNSLNVTNNSTITASGSAGLTLDPFATVTNNSTGRAVAGSTLTLTSGTFINTDGVYRAEGPGAIVNLIQAAELQCRDGYAHWGHVSCDRSAQHGAGRRRAGRYQRRGCGIARAGLNLHGHQLHRE